MLLVVAIVAKCFEVSFSRALEAICCCRCNKLCKKEKTPQVKSLAPWERSIHEYPAEVAGPKARKPQEEEWEYYSEEEEEEEERIVNENPKSKVNNDSYHDDNSEFKKEQASFMRLQQNNSYYADS